MKHLHTIFTRTVITSLVVVLLLFIPVFAHAAYDVSSLSDQEVIELYLFILDQIGKRELTDRLSGLTETEYCIHYICNANTGKFHKGNCSSVADIKPGNRGDYTGLRDILLMMGFDPCKRCKP